MRVLMIEFLAQTAWKKFTMSHVRLNNSISIRNFIKIVGIIDNE